MKLILDERAKHRIIGLAVFVSICAIFIPALMKKSSERFERNISLSIALPPEPVLPAVSPPNKSALFEKVKVAQVTVPSVNSELKPVSTLAKAKSLKPETPEVKIELAKVPDLKQPKVRPVALLKKVALPKTQKTNSLPLPQAKAKAFYSVQLAYFSRQKNAESLVHQLKAKGYQASYKKVMHKKDGVFYRVLVGAVPEKKQAVVLKDKLAQVVQLKGIVVNPREVG